MKVLAMVSRLKQFGELHTWLLDKQGLFITSQCNTYFRNKINTIKKNVKLNNAQVLQNTEPSNVT